MNEHEKLRGFVKLVAAALLADKDDASSKEMLSSLIQAVDNCKSIAGLRQAAQDMVESSQDLTAEDISRLDAQLKGANLPTLSQMRRREYRLLQRILRRGKLNSAAEYRTVEAVLSDTASTLLSEAEQNRANQLLADYDSQQGTAA